MRVFSQPRVKADIHRKREVPESVHPEGPSEIDGNGDLHGTCPFSGSSFGNLPLRHGLGKNRG